MGLHKLTPGDGYTYLTRQVAAHDRTERGHAGLADYYDEKGESLGRWVGTGLAGLGLSAGDRVTEDQMRSLFGDGRHPNSDAIELVVIAGGGTGTQAETAAALGSAFRVYAGAPTLRVEWAKAFTAYNTDRGLRWDTPLPAAERAAIRTETALRLFAERHGRSPLDGRELDGFIARESRQATTAVAGYDLTFSPVKSVSALWAVAPRDIARQIEEAHHAAVEDTLTWLEREAAYTRVGRAGARQVEVRGLIGAAFTHRDTRAGDPDLHTHVAVSNKVQESATGRWLALDGRVLYKANVAASERYNTRLEGELVGRLGVSFVERNDGGDKRPVREIDGVDPLLARYWSRRRAAVEKRYAELAVGFQADHGRPPSAVEALALKQRATLETRDAKHAPRREADQRRQWADEARMVLGDDTAVATMVRRSLRRNAPATRPNRVWVRTIAVRVVENLEASRATWQVWHVRAEAERQARAADVSLTELDSAVDRVVKRALTRCSVPLSPSDPVHDPRQLRRRDGTSVYEVHGATAYTSERILQAERRLLHAARAHEGGAVSEVRVSIALARVAASGTPLNEAQAAMVRDLAVSGSRLQVALAPAGSGKTTAMGVLADAWVASGGSVLGLAPSAQAAQELGQAVGVRVETLTKLTWTIANAPPAEWPTWVSGIGPETLLIVDEAGQAGTVELAHAVDFVLGCGGSVRLVGDDQQLAAVAAGGVLRDIVHTHGAATLSEVRRFTDPAEAAATLAVREGDASALGFYADHGRIHVGDEASVAHQAYVAWSNDRESGLDSLLLAPTRELVTRLNERARLDRLARTSDSTASPTEVRLGDGNFASVGDTVVTRRNERRLAHSPTDWVRNGDRWTVETAYPDDRLRVRHLGHGRSLTLPAEYVTRDVQLGYASTVHAAQGMTVDTAHAVLTGNEERQLMYVAVTRGRTANHLYVAAPFDGDPHSLVRPEAVLPQTAAETLAAVMARDGTQQSATTTRRLQTAPAALLHEAALRYNDALTLAAEQLLGSGRLAALDQEIDALVPGITEAPAYPTLRGHLALLAADGCDVLQEVVAEISMRELTTAEDAAAVVDWRLGSAPTEGPLPWLPAVPALLRDSAEWGSYLTARATRVAALAAQVQAEAASWTPSRAPEWARHLTEPEHTMLRGDLAVWRAAFAVPDSDHRLTGPRQLAAQASEQQRALRRRLREATGLAGVRRTWQLPDEVMSDPAVSRLLDRLAGLGRAGLDVQPLIDTATRDPRPLPAEVPADALWWRIAAHLGPAALRATGPTAETLRPSWTAVLTARLGEYTARRVMDDPAWPALVAAVQTAPDEWTPERLIATVTDGVVHFSGRPLGADELCEAMVWRIALLTDPPTEPDAPPSETLDVAVPVAVEPAVPVRRIIELNRMALDYYASLYPRSWAPDYLRDRLGSDLADHPQYAVGYAPPGPRTLVRHLAGRGATDEELVEAGLARRTDRGDTVDALRDRLVFPILRDGEIVGFIGRRNPTKDDTEYVGPKYLNTRATAVFTKGKLLYGLSEGRAALDAGARPVLVEGPLDALAISIASDGAAVGIAPLGTAFTPAQARQLKPLFLHEPSRMVVATDNDCAGREAARRAYWGLARVGADPQRLLLPEGHDPADLVQAQGARSLRQALGSTDSLAGALIDEVIAKHGDEYATRAAELSIVREASVIIAAAPPTSWLDHIDRMSARLQLPPGSLHREVLDAATALASESLTPVVPILPLGSPQQRAASAQHKGPMHQSPTRPHRVAR